MTIKAPSAPTAMRAEVVDNNVLLYWGAPTTGSLPIASYEVRKGSVWSTAKSLGSNGNSTFTAIFEQASGSYTYAIGAYDSAGNLGSIGFLTATVNQPPDYVLRSNIDSDLSGTKTNTYVENGDLFGPVPPETWATHFSGHSWTTIQDQIDAGYTRYANPSSTSGSYQETIDYGATVPATSVTVTPSTTLLQGTVTLTCQIDYKLNSGDAWTPLPAGLTGFIANNFRYLRVTLTMAATAGANLLKVSNINIKLASKLKTDAGMGTANSADSGGTVTTFNIPFVDVSSITVTPAAGGTARYGIYDFTDTANPTSFKVLLYDSSGARVSGGFSWTARGY
jgi:hypothetical protein